MPEYKAPLRDMSFVMNELLDAEGFNQTLPGYEEATRDLMDAIVEEGAKFAENVLSPLNEPGDDEGCVWSEEGVKTPSGFPRPTSSMSIMAGRRCLLKWPTVVRACRTCWVLLLTNWPAPPTGPG